MAIFSAVVEAQAVTAAQDIFELVAPSDSLLAIREIRIGQYSDFGDAAAEILSLLVIRGHTVAGSGGSAVTPVNRSPVSGALASTATVKRNNTTVATTSGVTVLADAWNIQTPYLYLPSREECILVNPGQRLVVRLSTPADSISVNATLVFEEMGQGPA